MKPFACVAVLLWGSVGLTFAAPWPMSQPAGQKLKFDVNDLAYLWPAPQNAADVAALISADITTAETTKRIWPEPVFKLLLNTATSFTIDGSAGTFQIAFAGFEEEFAKPSTWKLVGFRVDPSAPGGHDGFVSQFGSTPQLRMIFQPVTFVGGKVKVHDVAAHLAYSYVKPGPPASPAIPDQETMRGILEDLKKLKVASDGAGAPTAGPLRVHPGLQAKVPGFAEKVRTFIQQIATRGALTDLAFMGIQPPEPWIFFAMRKRSVDGAFERVKSQMLVLSGGAAVMPQPSNGNLPRQGGVSTAPLFRIDSGSPELAAPALTGATRPSLQDIPDIIANPHRSHVLNTDCVSCHTESTRRGLLKIAAGDGAFSYQRPSGISGIDETHLPQTQWNVRNFGWFQRGDKTQPTISMRTANEAAESADFVNREYFGLRGSPGPDGDKGSQTNMIKSVASPLTLVMNIKTPQDFLALKKEIEQMQSLPPDRNPIMVALTKLGTVHFARFVFLSERQFAVITTYDGTFEDYIDAFVNSIGKVFDGILEHIADAPPRPVELPENRQAFLEYVRKNDLAAVPPFYSAYPSLKVLDILTLQKQQGGR